MYRSYEYKSNSITDEDAKHAVKRAILYDQIDNATYGLKIRIEDDLANSGIRIVISNITDEANCADYVYEMHCFETVIESLLSIINAS